jgi:hypothetical protein
VSEARIPIINLDEIDEVFQRAASAARKASSIQKQFPSQKTETEQQRNVSEFLNALKVLTGMSHELQSRSTDLVNFAKALDAGRVELIRQAK